MIKPTVGRVVYYMPGDLDEDMQQTADKQPLRADIIAVNSDTSVNLNVIDAAGNHFPMLSVYLKQDDAEEPNPGYGGYAYWMPYQLGQAAKTEAVLMSGAIGQTTAVPALLKEFPTNADDQQLEAKIQAKGLNAPRLTPQHIDSIIANVDYTMLPSGRTLICELTLANGFTVRGESSVVSAANFDRQIGEEVSFNDARNKVWQLEAYLLKQRLFADEYDTLTKQPEFVARVAHEVNRAYCAALGDTSQPVWEDAPQWQKDSALLGVQLHTENPDASPAASHESWMAQKVADGWKYGGFKDPANKLHPCIVPFNQLDTMQQAKDYIFRAVVHALVHPE